MVYYIRMYTLYARRTRNIAIYTLLLIIAAGLYVLRQPSSFIHPQLYAEDALWLQHAYNDGIAASLFRPDTGYLQSLSRIVGAIAAFVPLEIAPFIFVYASLMIRVHFFATVISERNTILPGMQKYLLAFASILLPNTQEIHINFNYSQWYLALSALFTLLYDRPKTSLGRWCDMAVIIVSSLSGPFVLLFAPIILFKYLSQKKKYVLPYVWITMGASFLQLFFLLFDHRASILISNTAWGDFYKILESQIVFGSIIRREVHEVLYTQFGTLAELLGYLVMIMGVSIVLYTFIRASLDMRLLLAFGTGILVLSVFNSMARQDWGLLAITYGIRYWLVPRFVFLACVIFVVYDRTAPIWIKLASGVLVASFIATLLYGSANFRYEPLPDLNWNEHLSRFYELESGAQLEIPINPEDWRIVLVRR